MHRLKSIYLQELLDRRRIGELSSTTAQFTLARIDYASISVDLAVNQMIRGNGIQIIWSIGYRIDGQEFRDQVPWNPWESPIRLPLSVEPMRFPRIGVLFSFST